MNKELKPCPFCGCKANIGAFKARYYRTIRDFKDGNNSTSNSSYSIFCRGCEMKTLNYSDSDKAIAAWNDRSDE